MSRAEVIQSQLSHKLHRAPSVSPAPPSPSPSTSTSSQGSFMLDRPPPGWQKKMLLAQEHLSGQLNTSPNVSIAVPTNGSTGDVISTTLKNDTSLRSGSEDDDSIVGAVIPIDARERIMATSQSFQKMRYQQPPTTNMRPDISTPNISGRKMTFHQSWIMSSRTKRILNDASTPAPPFVGNAAKHDKKYLEMESVAIYMYTLVQCYKSEEKFRYNTSANDIGPVKSKASKAFALPNTSRLTKEKPDRREIVFSSKRLN